MGSMQQKPAMDHQEMLNRISLGDEQAYATFFKLHWPQVYGTGIRLTKSPEKAQDLAQDIFIKIWENREKLAHVGIADGYVYIIARNYILDYLRKKVFDTESIDYLVDYFRDSATDPQQKLEYKELELSLKTAIDNLPGKVKDVFVLSRFEGMTHQQIAEKLDISVTSSKTYIVRALQEIREKVMHDAGKSAVILSTLLIFHNLNK